ncbi:alpha/beta hydrolase [Acuticoccus sediminis]|uniref:alpha/beta hydrolase n=1 Tax=Acuticoccus sediminis TaxID=2184697 RepID=UPI0011B935FE|nr:alpha/beta hydrolase [Acuticoccus sediminis]
MSQVICVRDIAGGGVTTGGRRPRERQRRPAWRPQPVSEPPRTLTVQTCGPVEIALDGEILALPASRKTRALLGYLVLCGRPQRRERLCELFWEIPDDPRAALRWSLSKLRPLVNAAGETLLISDRDQVSIDTAPISVDAHRIDTCATREDIPVTRLEEAWESASRLLLENCELTNQPAFSAWLEQKRTEMVRLRIRIARRLATSTELTPDEADKWAERWRADAPFDPSAAQQSVLARRKLGREHEATTMADAMDRSFREAGLQPPDFSPPVYEVAGAPKDALCVGEDNPAPHQTIRFTQSDDAVTLAWTALGRPGCMPLVKSGCWPSHLELDWGTPVWGDLYRSLADDFRFVRYDERGTGLSDWTVPEISFERSVADLERVVDAAGFERVPLLGISHGAAVSIEFAARHPERVSHLILVGGYAAGWRHTASAEEIREREAVMLLTERGWSRANPYLRHILSQERIPGASAAELKRFDEVQSCSTSPANAARILDVMARIDVRERLRHVAAPTLVVHSRNDAFVPVSAGRALAAEIPCAEFVGLESENHLLLGREPATATLVAAIRRFLAP